METTSRTRKGELIWSDFVSADDFFSVLGLGLLDQQQPACSL
jgi:hypothetical protein